MRFPPGRKKRSLADNIILLTKKCSGFDLKDSKAARDKIEKLVKNMARIIWEFMKFVYDDLKVISYF